MIDEPAYRLPDGPVLLCAGTDSGAAVRLAETASSLLAQRPVVVLATWQPPPMMGPWDAVSDAFLDSHAALRQDAHDAAVEVARAARDALDAEGLDVTTRIVCEPVSSWRAILDEAADLDAAVIVAGISERPAAHPGALGREARALAHHTHRPLLLLPAGGERAAADAPAIFAVDDSPAESVVFDAAVALLAPRPALAASAWEIASYAVGVALLAVPDEVARTGAERLDQASERHAAGRAGEAAARVAAAGWSCDAVAPSARHNAAEAIIELAHERDAAIVVTGTHGRSRVAAALLGSTSEAILRHSGRPVLVLPLTTTEV